MMNGPARLTRTFWLFSKQKDQAGLCRALAPGFVSSRETVSSRAKKTYKLIIVFECVKTKNKNRYNTRTTARVINVQRKSLTRVIKSEFESASRRVCKYCAQIRRRRATPVNCRDKYVHARSVFISISHGKLQTANVFRLQVAAVVLGMFINDGRDDDKAVC